MVTSINTLRALGTIQEVELPGWNENDTVTFRLGRPSMMMMVHAGQIPNSLLATAQQLFAGAGVASKESFNDIIDVMITVVKATLVEPTYDEIKAAGIELTDEQLITIFQYGQQGAAALTKFRAQRAHATATGDQQAI